MKMEIWKDIKGYEGLYQVSNLGRVYSVVRGKHLKARITKAGYSRVHLSKNNQLKDFAIHRLVAQTFIPNPDNKPQVNHLDENKLNNRVKNLEWCTQKENINFGTCIERTHLKQRKQVLCVETGVIYPSVTQLAKENGYSISFIAMVCRGERKCAYGLTWRYV